MVLHTPAKTQKSLQLHVSSFFTALPQCSPEGQKMGAIEEERIRGWEGCPEPKTSWFSRKESSKLPVAVFLFWKQLIPGPLPADMIPRLQETTCMNRSRWTVWGFYHCRSDWIPQIQRWAFFFFFFLFHGPAEISLPKQVQWSQTYLWLYPRKCVCQAEMWAHLCVCLVVTGSQITSLFKHALWFSAMVSRLQEWAGFYFYKHSRWITGGLSQTNTLIIPTRWAWAEC